LGVPRSNDHGDLKNASDHSGTTNKTTNKKGLYPRSAWRRLLRRQPGDSCPTIGVLWPRLGRDLEQVVNNKLRSEMETLRGNAPDEE
jgi:hypothetical protein